MTLRAATDACCLVATILRRLVDVATLSFLIAAAAVAAVALRSVWVADDLTREFLVSQWPGTDRGVTLMVASSAGGFVIQRDLYTGPTIEGERGSIESKGTVWTHVSRFDDFRSLAVWFRIIRWRGAVPNSSSGTAGSFRSSTIVITPDWAIFVVVVALPAIRIARWVRRRRRVARGRCAICGYDLRASHDRCPECGKPMESGKRIAPDESNGGGVIG